MIFYKPLKSFLEEYNDKNVDNKYKTVAVGKYGIRTRESIYSKELAKDYSKNKLIYKNTLTVGMGSKQIDIGILSDNHVFSVSPAYHTFKISNINPDYLRYCLQARNPDMFIRYVKRGSRQGKAIDLKRWLTYEIPIHEKLVQKEIVKTLDVVKDLLEAYKEELDRYDELVKSRFVEIFGELSSNPYGWETFTMGECFDITSSKRILKSEWRAQGIPFLRVRDIVQLATTGQMENEYFVSEEFYKSLSDYDGVPQRGDILVSATSTLGKCHVVGEEERYYFKDADVLRFRAKKKINPIFFVELMKEHYIEEQISKTLGITTVAHFTIKAAKNINMRCPDIELQNEFANFVAQVDKSKLTLCRYNINVNK